MFDNLLKKVNIQIPRIVDSEEIENCFSQRNLPVLFKIEDFALSDNEKDVLPSLFSNILDVSIEDVSAKHHVGRVFLFDITPYKMIDPAFVYCDVIDMTDYNYIWGQMARGESINKKICLGLINDLINRVRLSFLKDGEKNFLMSELMKFQNYQIRRAKEYHPYY